MRRASLRRLETLEDRTLLNASIDIDGALFLTYDMDPTAAETLKVSLSGGTYTFSSTVDIDTPAVLPTGMTVVDANTVTVTAASIVGIDVNSGFANDEVDLFGTNVATTINLTGTDAAVTLGDSTAPLGLGLITAPVVVVGAGTGSNSTVNVDDGGSIHDTEYTITGTTVDAANGFGGLTYSGLATLNVVGAANMGLSENDFVVNGTADGVATTLDGTLAGLSGVFFDVSATSAVAGSSLDLIGSNLGDSAFHVAGAAGAVNITGGGGQNGVHLGDVLTNDVSGVTGTVTLVGLATGGDEFLVAINDTLGVNDDNWTLTAQAAPSMFSALTGLGTGGDGSLVYQPGQVNGLGLVAAPDQSNRLTIDFQNGSPLPTGGVAPSIVYQGGNTLGAVNSDLVLIDALGTVPIDTQTHDVTGLGAGEITFSDLTGSITYSNLSPHSVYDTLTATNYIFNDTADPDGHVLISAGVNSALTGNVQSLLISSQAATPSSTDTYVANKTNITVNVSNALVAADVTVDYGIAAPVAGLTTLTVDTDLGADSAHLVALPPGVTTNLDQGAGDDMANVTVAGTAPATETNLDGGLGTNILILDASDLAITPANFAAGPGGSTVISGAPLPGGPITYVNYQQVIVTTLAAAPPVVTAATINAVQGQRQDDVIVGTFTSTATGARANDFSATIDWGDGTQSAGVIVQDATVQDATQPAVFYVMGTHTFYEDDPALTTHVTVASLNGSSTFTEIINDVPVTFNISPIPPVTADGAAVVDNAPISVWAASFSGIENTAPTPPADVFAASFIDYGGVNPTDLDPAARYSVVINWGDGSTPLPVPASGIVRNGTSNSYTVIVPQHVYDTPGAYVVTMFVSDGGANAVLSTATGVAYIADAPLTSALIQPLVAPATEGVLIDGVQLASFTDGNPLSKPGDFKVVIDWGDGSPTSTGTLVQPGGAGDPYFVEGTHTYADALRAGAPPVAWGPGPIAPVTTNGTFPISIYVQDAYGSAVILSNTITVNDNPLNLAGSLNPASDSGASNSDGITNVVQPSFQGWTSEGGAMVFVYATPTGGAPMLIGRTSSDANGAWSVTSTSALDDGGYTIQAQAYDALGHTVSALTTVTTNLVIDTVGPKVTDVVFDNLGGQVIATFQDLGGVDGAGVGLNQATVVDANNYRFALMRPAPIRGYHPPARWLVNAITVQPGDLVGPQVATIRINNGRGIRGGNYLFTARSVDPANLTGIRDVAGNALDGEFYSYFPSGNNHVGGDFVARLDAVHHRVFAPATTVGRATPVHPPGRPGVDRFIARPGRQLPRAYSAVKLSAARATVGDTSIRQLFSGR